MSNKEENGHKDALRDALAAVTTISSDSDRADALAALAPHLPEALLPQALALASAISDSYHRTKALAALVPYLPETDNKSFGSRLAGYLNWRLLNQPFVLWGLSALLISFAGAYYSLSSRCNALASSDYLTAVSLLREMQGRASEINAILVSRIDESRLSPAEISEAADGVRAVLLGDRGFQTPQFKDHRLSEVVSAFNRAYRRIRPDDALVEDARKATQQKLDKEYNGSLLQEPKIDPNIGQDIIIESASFYNWLLVKNPVFESEQLGQIQGRSLPSDQATLTFYDRLFSESLPQNQCAPLNIIHMMTGGVEPRILVRLLNVPSMQK